MSEHFAMKDLGEAKQILRMRISMDREACTLKLSQEEYVKRVLSRFSMQDVKPMGSLLASHFKLLKEQYLLTDEERKSMQRVPYALAIGSLMYDIVCTLLDITHAVGVVSMYMGNPGKKHCEALKWALGYLRGTIEVAFVSKE